MCLKLTVIFPCIAFIGYAVMAGSILKFKVAGLLFAGEGAALMPNDEVRMLL